MSEEEKRIFLKEIGKTQWIRLYVDVLFLGPFLVYLAAKYKTQFSDLEKLILIFSGIGTSAYNAHNYIKQKEILKSL